LELRNQELAALNAVARATSQHLERDEMLAEALDKVMRLIGMESGEIFLLDEPTGDMVLALYRGPAAEAFQTITRFKPGEGIPGRVAETGVAIDTTGSLSDGVPEVTYWRQAVLDAGFKSHVYAPLRVKNRIIGVMGLASRSRQTFSERQLEMLEAIGHQVGLGVENAHLYHQVGQLAVVEERSRIGMDLHDGVIQSIYAAGLTLESARLALPDGAEEVNRLLGHVVEALNEAIGDIRNFILDLRPHRFEGDLNEGLVRLVREFQANTMVAVEHDVSPEAIARLPAAMARAIFMTTQEALANIARHARATQVKVSLQPVDSAILLKIVDNGRGFDTGRRTYTGHGLANMRSRTEELGGTFTIHSAPGQGTSLQMKLPL
jgi:signal transduction histidine kinase